MLERIYTYDPFAGADSSGVTPAPCWTDLRALGETLLREKPATATALDALATAVQPGDLATLIYTSGTTGQPKGVMLSHNNLMSNCMAIVPLMDGGPEDRAISFLPLCHIFERTLTNAYIYSGMSIYYAESLEKSATICVRYDRISSPSFRASWRKSSSALSPRVTN